jgi:hypothetical protein
MSRRPILNLPAPARLRHVQWVISPTLSGLLRIRRTAYPRYRILRPTTILEAQPNRSSPVRHVVSPPVASTYGGANDLVSRRRVEPHGVARQYTGASWRQRSRGSGRRAAVVPH